MTPDAVIYRYLQLISAEHVDVDALCRLLAADADLLVRWLKLLNVPADVDQLRQHIANLSDEEFDGLAQAQAWTVLPIVGAARLSANQWLSVLNAAFLAEVLYENLFQPAAEYAQRDGENIRLRILLAISGVQLSQDPWLNQLIEYRGTQAELLEDAELELRIFAVVDGLEFGKEEELARTLLDLPEERFQDLWQVAQNRTQDLVSDLRIDMAGDVDWAHRIWLRQQIVVVTTALGQAQDWVELTQLHDLASRCLFVRPPLLLQFDPIAAQINAPSGQRIAANSKSSKVALAHRDQQIQSLADSSDTAVVDRQLIKLLGCEQAVVVPVPGARVLLMVADDDEIDVAAAAQLYAEQFAKYIPGEEEAGEVDDETGMALELVDEFRALEAQRLREVVHEANNPLSIVHNYLHILELRLQHEPEAVEQINLIASELRRAAEVFAQARNIPAGTLVEPQPSLPGDESAVELGAWVKGVVELHGGFAMEHGVTLSQQIPQDTLLLHTHTNNLSQIVGNLLKNAIEACSIGGHVEVGCRDGVVRSGQPGFELFVNDNGPGLDPETLKNIAGIKESSKGGDHQGVGLHMAFRLTAEIGAALDVHTSKDQGTRFTLFLPLIQPPGDEAT